MKACLPILGSLLLGVTGCNQSATEPVTNVTQQEMSTESTASVPASESWAAQIDQAAPAETITVHAASQSRVIQNDLLANSSQLTGMSEQVAVVDAVPSSGSPEWDIQQIAAILAEVARNPASGSSGNGRLAVPSEEQNRRIVALATHAISLTHSRPEKELVFNAAVHSLMDARLNLALSGDQESLNAIYEDAATLAEKHAQSEAATTAAAAIVKLTSKMAQREGRNSPWVSEYVRQAKLFAANFPGDEARAIVQLTSAAEFCEQHQLILPAIECYTFAQQQFPKSPFAPRTEAALQRLNLVGKPLLLEGPTLSQEAVKLSDLVGRPVLLAFWSSQSAEFVEDLASIRELSERSGCQLLGINLDTQEEHARQFVAAHQLAGQHIFYPDTEQRGASQPFARHFGIHQVPSYWLIDKEGKVLSTCVTREQLQGLVQKTRQGSSDSGEVTSAP